MLEDMLSTESFPAQDCKCFFVAMIVLTVLWTGIVLIVNTMFCLLPA